MRFHQHFTRAKGVANISTESPALGTATDPEPTFATTGAPANSKDNVLQAKVAGVGNAIQRVAVGYWFSAGSGVALTAKLWVYDRNCERWFLCSSGTLTDGQITYFRVPYLADPPQNGTLSKPTSGGAEYMLTVADNSGADGVYHFSMGADTAQF